MKTGSKKLIKRIVGMVAAVCLAVTQTIPAYCLPQINEIVNGDVTTSINGSNLEINATDKTIINYDSFNIGLNEQVLVTLPDSNSEILNRVIGSSVSEIFGGIECNGRFILVNENGIRFNQGSWLNAKDFILSTRDITNQNFLQDSYIFEKTNQALLDQLFVNQGNLTTTDAGFGVIIAGGINNEGVIAARLGTAALLGAEKVTLTLSNDSLISVAIDKAQTTAIENVTDQIASSGSLTSDGGLVLISAQSLPDIFSKSINLTGVTRAVEAESVNGEINLFASGHVESKGTLRTNLLEEDAASFKVGGSFSVERSSIRNDDDAITLTTGMYSGNVIDFNDIVIDDNAIITLDGALTFWADFNFDGTGAFIMNPGSSIVGQGYDLGILVSESSVLRTITGVNGLGIAGSTASNPLIVMSPTETLSVVNFQLTDVQFNRFTGSGTSGDPYMIYDVYGLQGMKGYLDDSTVYFGLANDIDASSTVNWNGGDGFDPIGDNTTNFTGSFDGGRNVITGLTVNRSGENYIGLFGYANTASISNIGLENVSITGANTVGGVAGFAGVTPITNSYVTGTVNAASTTSIDGVGGLVGSYVSETISNCFSTAAVTNSSSTDSYTGGLAGVVWAVQINNSYATGNVTANGASSFGGGFIGFAGLTTLTNNYSSGAVAGTGQLGGFAGVSSATHNDNFWDITVNSTLSDKNSENVAGITSLTTAEMMDSSNFTGWDFTVAGDGTIGNWIMAGTPHLQMEHTTTISDVVDLQLMAVDLTAGYTLANDIDASSTVNWNDGDGFSPVGDDSDNFDGQFDGNNFSIENLYIKAGSNYSGLFGYTGATADISNLNLENIQMQLRRYSGGLAGYIDGSTVSNVTVSGTIDNGLGPIGTSAELGGLAGYARNATVSDSSSSVAIDADDKIGGLIGVAYNSVVSNCYATGNVDSFLGNAGGLIGQALSASTVDSSYATGDVTGANHLGGLIGQSSSTITDSYAEGSVTSYGSYAGGLVGFSTGSITGSHAIGAVSGDMYLGGLTGLTTADVINSWATGSVVSLNLAYTGGLVGHAIGNLTIDNCYSTGNVTGAAYTGGVVGALSNGASVNNSYALGDVSGTLYVGGLVGHNASSSQGISDSYASGDVSGTYNLGGLVGFQGCGSIAMTNQVNNSFYNIDEVLINGTNQLTLGGIYNQQYTDWINNSKSLNVDNYFNSSGGYYLINNVSDFKNFLGFSYDSSLNFKLNADIDLSSESNFYIPYLGSNEFDGSEFTVSNVSINSLNGNIGFFGIVNETDIKNLNLSNVSVINTYDIDNIGGLFGFSYNADISNVDVSSTIDSSGDRVGGFAGYMYLGTVSESSSVSTVNGYMHTGGLIGYALDVDISDSYSLSSVTGSSQTGGLIGYYLDGLLQRSYTAGDVQSGSNVGGLIGAMSDGAVFESFSLSDVVSTSSYSGGLVGTILDGDIYNSYALGSVTGTDGVGGLVGFMAEFSTGATISNSFSAGQVDGSSNVGGLCGDIMVVTISNSYWNTETSGQAASAGGVGLTTAEMMTEANFTGFDFTNDWDINNNETYPYLEWQDLLQGTVYSDSASTLISSPVNLSVVINGVLYSTTSTAPTGSSNVSAFYLPVGNLSTNDAILVYVEDNEINSNLLANGLAGDLLYTSLYADTVTIASGTTIGQDNISKALGSLSDSDFLFSLSGGNLSMSSNAIVAEGTFELGSDTTVSADLSVWAPAALDTQSYDLTVGGDIWMPGTFVEAASTVTLNGTEQSVVMYSNAFYNLTKTNGGSLTFDAGSLTTVNGKLTLTGTAQNPLILKSSTAGSKWQINAGSQLHDLDYLDVSDSDNVGGSVISTTNSVLTNTTNWQRAEDIVVETTQVEETVEGEVSEPLVEELDVVDTTDPTDSDITIEQDNEVVNTDEELDSSNEDDSSQSSLNNDENLLFDSPEVVSDESSQEDNEADSSDTVSDDDSQQFLTAQDDETQSTQEQEENTSVVISEDSSDSQTTDESDSDNIEEENTISSQQETTASSAKNKKKNKSQRGNKQKTNKYDLYRFMSDDYSNYKKKYKRGRYITNTIVIEGKVLQGELDDKGVKEGTVKMLYPGQSSMHLRYIQ